MFRDRAWDLSLQAAEITLGRVREDRRRSSELIRPILEYIERHLHDVGLRVGEMFLECGVTNKNQVYQQFAEDLGTTPNAYIINRRMETAAWMLSRSNVDPWRVGTNVGYASSQSFGKAFLRWSGLTPTEYREKHAAQPALAASPEGLVHEAVQRKALDGKLSPEEAQELGRQLDHFQERLRSLYPESQETEARPLGADLFERSVARGLWQEMRDLPAAEQRSIIRHQVELKSPALFAILCRECLEIGRSDARRGVEIAELIPLSLSRIAAGLGEDLPSYEAHAWTKITQARMLASDLDGADRAFERAQKALFTEGLVPDLWVFLEFCICGFALRVDQGNLEEAGVFIVFADDHIERMHQIEIRRRKGEASRGHPAGH